MREPFPNDLVIEAWNARQGWSFDRNRTQAACFPLVQSKHTTKSREGKIADDV